MCEQGNDSFLEYRAQLGRNLVATTYGLFPEGDARADERVLAVALDGKANEKVEQVRILLRPDLAEDLTTLCEDESKVARAESAARVVAFLRRVEKKRKAAQPAASRPVQMQAAWSSGGVALG